METWRNKLKESGLNQSQCFESLRDWGLYSKKLFVTLTYFLSFEMRHGSIF